MRKRFLEIESEVHKVVFDLNTTRSTVIHYINLSYYLNTFRIRNFYDIINLAQCDNILDFLLSKMQSSKSNLSNALNWNVQIVFGKK